MTKPQYGHEHQLRRRRLVPAALGRPCPGCGRVMLKGMALDAAHNYCLKNGNARYQPLKRTSIQ